MHTDILHNFFPLYLQVAFPFLYCQLQSLLDVFKKYFSSLLCKMIKTQKWGENLSMSKVCRKLLVALSLSKSTAGGEETQRSKATEGLILLHSSSVQCVWGVNPVCQSYHLQRIWQMHLHFHHIRPISLLQHVRHRERRHGSARALTRPARRDFNDDSRLSTFVYYILYCTSS
jgi:hypothetical protein